MSDAADRTRAVKRDWAEPGSRHDLVVRLLKIGLPSLVGIFLAILLMAPLSQHGEVSFIFDKKQAEKSPERMRADAPRYSGADDKGQPFVVTADQALQHSSSVPIVDIRGIAARLGLARGPVDIRANVGRYDLDHQKLAFQGPVHVAGNQGEDLATSNVQVDFNTRTLSGEDHVSGQTPLVRFNGSGLRADLERRQVALERGVTGQMKLGNFSANQMHADLNHRTIVLDGRARLKITQGAVR